MSDKFVTVKEFETYKKEADKKFNNVLKKEKKTRAPNAYNDFMREEVAKLKLADPTVTNQTAFKLGAVAWNKKKADASQ